MLNENVVRLLESGMWDLATCADGEPNVVPVAFKDVTPDGKLMVGDVFLDTTLKNIAANNGRIAVSVYDAQNLEGYQVKGAAQYVTEGEVVNAFKAMVEKMFSGAATAKDALIIANGIVERKSYDEIPPRVEYSLTEKGASVVPILQSICQWAGVFYKDGGETPMIQCQKCDHRE